MKRCLGCMSKYDNDLEVCPFCGYVDGTPAKEAFHLKPGTVLQNRYIIGRVLGFGGFGVTYIGFDTLLEKKVAIKEYLPSEFATRMPQQDVVSIYAGEKEEQFTDGLQKFVEEAKKLAKFQSVDGIVSIFDSFEENQTAYIIMEYLDGMSLSDKIKRDGKMPIEEAIQTITPVLTALSEVHKTGIIHRDISPDNIFIAKDGKVTLLDFGAARYATTMQSRSLSVIVKPGYAPEEQYRSRGEQGSWTDVYAMAATLYKMITGITPDDALERRANDKLKPPSKLGISISRNQENALMNALNIRAEDRTQSAELFLSELTSGNEITRLANSIKKMDVGKMPVGIKIAIAALAVILVTGIVLLATGIINPRPEVEANIEIAEGKTRVPSLINSLVEDAEKRSSEAKLVLLVAGKENSDSIAENMVLSQNYMGGALIDENTALEVIISAGVEKVYVPNLIGKKRSEAEQKLTNLGLKVRTEEICSEIVIDSVAGMSPEAGNSAEKGTTILLYISKGLENIAEDKAVKVLDVTGRQFSEAQKLLGESGLYINKSEEVYSAAVPQGEIICQNPSAGETVNTGTIINVTVSLGEELVRVPDVTLKDIYSATQLLTDNQLAADVKFEESDAVAEGVVIRQETEAGISVQPGSEITIYVCRKSQDSELQEADSEVLVMPNYLGKQSMTAKAYLEEQGIKVVIKEEYSETTSKGYIIKTSTGAGETLNVGDSVTITVSLGSKAVTNTPTPKPTPTNTPTPKPTPTNTPTPKPTPTNTPTPKPTPTNTPTPKPTTTNTPTPTSTPTPTPTWTPWTTDNTLSTNSNYIFETNNVPIYRYCDYETTTSRSNEKSGWTLISTDSSWSEYGSYCDWSNNSALENDSTDVQYRYREKKYTTGSSASMEGWTQYGTPTFVVGTFGEWTQDVLTEDDSCVVETKNEELTTEIKEYQYYAACYWVDGVANKSCYAKSGYSLRSTITYSSGINAYEGCTSSNKKYNKIVSGWSTTMAAGDSESNGDGYSGTNYSIGGFSYWGKSSRTNTVTSTVTMYRKATKNYTYSFWKWGDYSSASESQPSITSDCEVQYRFRTRELNYTYTFERYTAWSDFSEIAPESYIGRRIETSTRTYYRYREK